MKYIIIFCFSLFVFFSCDLFLAGSYPYAENYTILNTSRCELIEKIKLLKEEYPEYKLINTQKNGGKGEQPEGIRKKDSLFYTVYFYIPKEDINLLCAINMSKQVKNFPATIKLVNIGEGVEFRGTGKTINNRKEISKEENEKIKRIFETEILDKLGPWKRK